MAALVAWVAWGTVGELRAAVLAGECSTLHLCLCCMAGRAPRAEGTCDTGNRITDRVSCLVCKVCSWSLAHGLMGPLLMVGTAG